MNKKYYVYGHYRKSDGVLFYIGKGSGKRAWWPHGRSEHWARIASKHGFYHKLLFSGLSEVCAFSMEKALIAFYGRDRLCNQSDGGEGNSGPSDETRLKMSLAKIGKVKSPDAIRKHAEKLRGRKMPIDAIEKTSSAHRGMKRSEEARARMRESSAARWAKPEEREKARIAAIERCKKIKEKNNETTIS